MVRIERLVEVVKTVVATCEPFAIGEQDMGLLLTTLAGRRGDTSLYRVERIEGAQVAYKLTKLHCPGTDPEETAYCVNLSASTCECKGFLRHGRCKHLTGTRNLFERGLLP
jgi:hypothetical protein